MGKYDDIIGLPHFRSPYRTPMPMENRAAQFAPFAALSGHDEAIAETSRFTDHHIDLTDEEKLLVSKIIQEAYSSQKFVAITYFVPDKSKTGGAYTSVEGQIYKIDETEHRITLDNGLVIPMDNIYSIRIT